ncbi:transposable element Tcb1 transposase [Trichonephila clavipes]|uniref:Transposable element Tcb1 transposase n=1 Tax=Trichonephila clavipes TaxID=2585209 RepID=A0A8X6VNQ0_TRICX|nr:transposable element Tcb1 transposase [Trichonephila clavipes]
MQVLFTVSRCRFRVRRYRGERTLAACIRHCYTSPSPGVMVWGAIGYTDRSPRVRSDSSLNSTRYISGVLRPVSLPFIQALQNPTFQQDNTRPHITGIVRTFLDTKNVQLLPEPARGPWFLSNWLVTIRQSLRLMRCGDALKLHGHLYLYMPCNLYLTQCPAV